MAAMKPATANGNTCVEEGTGCPDEVLYQTPDGMGVIAHGFQKWNGYTVFRFNKVSRSVTFEI